MTNRALAIADDGPSATNILDLGLGHPDDSLLPYELVSRAATLSMRTARPRLQYGAERGEADFRRSVSALITRQSNCATDPDRLFTTAGASVALSIVCTLFACPGDVVLVEDPTYHLALQLFRDQHLDVVAVPGGATDGNVLDERQPQTSGSQVPRPNVSQGISLDALERVLEERNGAEARRRKAPSPGSRTGDPARHGRVALLYLVPFFSNPAGATMPAEQRRRLLELTAAYDVTVVSDEVYRFLAFDGVSPTSLAGPDAPHVLALNSFSKVLAPGLRLGWLEGSPERLEQIERSGILMSGGGLNPFVAGTIGPLLDDGSLDEHLKTLRTTYETRAGALTDALDRYLPRADFEVPTGGYFVWLDLPGVDTATLASIASRHGVHYQPGTRFRAAGGRSTHARLGFSYYAPDVLEEAARRLGRAVTEAGAGSTTVEPAS